MKALDATYSHTRSWAQLDLDPPNEVNVVAFSSGIGDGLYPTYFGFKEETPVCVMTEFILLDSQQETAEEWAAKSSHRWWQFWK